MWTKGGVREREGVEAVLTQVGTRNRKTKKKKNLLSSTFIFVAVLKRTNSSSPFWHVKSLSAVLPASSRNFQLREGSSCLRKVSKVGRCKVTFCTWKAVFCSWLFFFTLWRVVFMWRKRFSIVAEILSVLMPFFLRRLRSRFFFSQMWYLLFLVILVQT